MIERLCVPFHQKASMKIFQLKFNQRTRHFFIMATAQLFKSKFHKINHFFSERQPYNTIIQ